VEAAIGSAEPRRLEVETDILPYRRPSEVT
jgi:hypothetical protein